LIDGILRGGLVAWEVAMRGRGGLTGILVVEDIQGGFDQVE